MNQCISKQFFATVLELFLQDRVNKMSAWKEQMQFGFSNTLLLYNTILDVDLCAINLVIYPWDVQKVSNKLKKQIPTYVTDKENHFQPEGTWMLRHCSFTSFGWSLWRQHRRLQKQQNFAMWVWGMGSSSSVLCSALFSLQCGAFCSHCSLWLWKKRYSFASSFT